jgi:predicted nucleic acid-binding protein
LVRLVIADTGPINYLILIGHIDLLPALFEKVILPSAVQAELTARSTPSSVRNWVAELPAWVEVRETSNDFDNDPLLKGIDERERAAINLSATLNADLLLMDDRKGVTAARRKGLRVTGTLGILELATRDGLVDFAQAIGRLRQTNFRSPDILDALLEKHRKKKTKV